MHFKVFGQVEASRDGESFLLGKSKVGQMLSLLLARSNEVVSIDALIDELWGDRVPRTAVTTLQTYVYHARKLFETELRVEHPEQLLVTCTSGYLMALADTELDAILFEALISEGMSCFNDGHAEAALDHFSKALSLSRSPAFLGMPMGRSLEMHSIYLQELRLSAISVRVDAYKSLGRHRELIPELRSLVSENPLNENFHAQLIDSLHHCGRRAEALQAYQRLSNVLDVELGVRPSLQLQDLYQKLLV
ncbi:AfsR/SARP family transcriptional regulator [Streptomyces sp. V4I2]|uniref:AfsR/SARP family transcriptional regulator n=1 Tax=Streptomyces sp. V4I2 TaxID=3042280 RepID=UPI0027D861D5|nr:AfsR/SARP family transcriptional regulator [Streptomyces sp. V4I2]